MSPVDLEVFRNLFVSIADEMGAVLRRTAFSANIKERRDYSCAVYDADGQTIAMGDHMPVHLGAMPLSVGMRSRRSAWGRATWPSSTIRFAAARTCRTSRRFPASSSAESARADFYVANRAHHADVGGMSPGIHAAGAGDLSGRAAHPARPADARRQGPARRDGI